MINGGMVPTGEGPRFDFLVMLCGQLMEVVAGQREAIELLIDGETAWTVRTSPGYRSAEEAWLRLAVLLGKEVL